MFQLHLYPNYGAQYSFIVPMPIIVYQQQQIPNQNVLPLQEVQTNQINLLHHFMEDKIKEEANPNETKPLESQQINLVLVKMFAQILYDIIQLKNTDEIQLQKKMEFYYSQGSQSRKIFDVLYEKYANSRKSKEQLTKYILRRAFKFIFQNFKQQKKFESKNKESPFSVLKKYFTQEELHQLPFRKNSKIKTMNEKFVSASFASQKFRDDYSQFLENFNDILLKDNKKKYEKMITQLEKSIEEGKFDKIESYTRIPWTFADIQQAKKFSRTLPEAQNKELL